MIARDYPVFSQTHAFFLLGTHLDYFPQPLAQGHGYVPAFWSTECVWGYFQAGPSYTSLRLSSLFCPFHHLNEILLEPRRLLERRIQLQGAWNPESMQRIETTPTCRLPLDLMEAATFDCIKSPIFGIVCYSSQPTLRVSKINLILIKPQLFKQTLPRSTKSLPTPSVFIYFTHFRPYFL